MGERGRRGLEGGAEWERGEAAWVGGGRPLRTHRAQHLALAEHVQVAALDKVHGVHRVAGAKEVVAGDAHLRESHVQWWRRRCESHTRWAAPSVWGVESRGAAQSGAA